MECDHVEIIMERVCAAQCATTKDAARVITETLLHLGYNLRTSPTLAEMKELLVKAVLATRPPCSPPARRDAA